MPIIMEQADGYSMTPPHSPIFQALQQLQDEEEDMDIPEQLFDIDPALTVPVCFCCQGEVDLPINTHADGHLRTGAIDRLQNCGFKKFEISSPTLELFGFTFDRYTALQDNRATLFNLFRLGINKLEKASKSSGFISTASDSGDYMKIRQDSRSLFDFVQQYLQGNPSSAIVPELLQELQDLLLFVGRLHELPRTIIGQAASKFGNKSGSACYHLFHLHLEIQWGVLETIQILEIKFSDEIRNPAHKLCVCKPECDFGENLDPVNETIHLLLWDLVLIAVDIYNRVAPGALVRTSPFLCTCLREFYVLLIQLLQYRQQKYAKQSFWVAITSVLQNLVKTELANSSETMEIDSNVYLLPFEVKCEDIPGFTWWFLLHVAPLYNYDKNGCYSSSKTPLPNNYYLAQELVKKSLTANELSLRNHLRCCLTVVANWEPSNRIVNLLWEHFYKRLNEQFKSRNTGLTGHSCIFKRALTLYENCRRISDNDLEGLENDTSYQMFLRLLSQYLQRSAQPLQAWKQIKGRFYSKFHSGRVHELTDVGIQNVTVLFVILANVADTEDVTSKLCDLLSMVTLAPSVQPCRRLAVWKAYFSLMLMYMRTDKPIGFIAEKVAPEFDKLASALAETRDSSAYSTLWPLIVMYTEGTQDVLDYSPNLGLQEYKLLGIGLSVLLPKCRDSDLKYLLNYIQVILNKYRMVQCSQKEKQQAGTWCNNPSGAASLKALCDRLWQNIYGFVKQHSTTQTPPRQLAEIASTFTVMALDVPTGVQVGIKEDFVKCFTYFSSGESVNPLVSCQYLCQVLAIREVTDRLETDIQDHQGVLIQAWYRCHWYLLPDNTHLQELTSQVICLPQMKEILSDIDSGEESPVVRFLAALGSKYKDILDLRARLELRTQTEKYFGDVAKHLAQVLKNCSSSELVKNVYSLAGNMTKYCASLTYVSMKQNCLLPALMDKLILPRSFAIQNKDLPPNVMSALKEYLHLFVCGFRHLDYKGDPYIQRKVKELITLYFTRFPITSVQTMSGVQIHPFVAALSDDTTALRQHILSVIVNEFMIGWGGTNSLQAIQFFLEVVRKSRNSSLVASDCKVLLSPMLTQLLENSHYRAPIIQVVSALLEAGRKHPDNMPREELQRITSTAVTSSLPMYQSQVFKSLEAVVQSNTALFVDLIPVMTGAVKLSEMKRGLGVDKQLRVSYCNLLIQLGPHGRDEKSKLLSS